jgi:hypothetical protein
VRVYVGRGMPFYFKLPVWWSGFLLARVFLPGVSFFEDFEDSEALFGFFCSVSVCVCVCVMWATVGCMCYTADGFLEAEPGVVCFCVRVCVCAYIYGTE